MEDALRSSGSVVTPLHGSDFGQAWLKKIPKTLHLTQNDHEFQTTEALIIIFANIQCLVFSEMLFSDFFLETMEYSGST